MCVRVGVDIGGTTISAGLIDSNGNILAKKSTDTLSYQGAQLVIARMSAMIKQLISEYDVQNLAGIGIGCPGEIERSVGIVTYSNNLGWNNVALKQIIANEFGLPVYIENDANCAALGELSAGAGKKYNDMIMITLGTGIGGSIIINKQLYSGVGGAAGIIGHTVIKSEGKQCNCGRKGCWETYASVSALIDQAGEKADEFPESMLFERRLADGCLSGKSIFELVRAGDFAAEQVYEKYISYVAEGIVNLVNTFDPDGIVIGGGISKEKEFLIEPLKKAANKKRYCRGKGETEIVASSLGNDAGIVGAAYLCL